MHLATYLCTYFHFYVKSGIIKYTKVVILVAVKPDMTRVTINIEKNQNEQLKELAKEENRSVSNYVRNLILQKIEEKEKNSN